MSGHFHVWSYDKYVMSGFTHKSFFAYVRTAKAQASLRICTVSPEPSLFTWWIYGPRGRFRQRIEHLAPFSFCTCAFMWSLHADMLRTFYAWWRSNNVIHWISTTSYEKFKYFYQIKLKIFWPNEILHFQQYISFDHNVFKASAARTQYICRWVLKVDLRRYNTGNTVQQQTFNSKYNKTSK